MLIRVFVLFIFFLFQLALRDSFVLWGITPNFLIIGLALTVKKNNLLDGVLIGAGCGLFYDFISYSTFGSGILTLTFAGFLTVFLTKHIFTENKFSKVLIVFLVALLHGAITLFIINYFYARINIAVEIIRLALPVSIYSALLYSLLLLGSYFSDGKFWKKLGLYGA
ncbi:MAG: rod shape-determining protein MreD [Candidatus Firestonebacteria bacterium]|nr:rod shape-determining protein MreD [Candidatus Firestonebacteria bacterium]